MNKLKEKITSKRKHHPFLILIRPPFVLFASTVFFIIILKASPDLLLRMQSEYRHLGPFSVFVAACALMLTHFSCGRVIFNKLISAISYALYFLALFIGGAFVSVPILGFSI